MTLKPTRNFKDFTFQVSYNCYTPEQSKAASAIIFTFADPNAEHPGLQTIM